MTWIAAAITLGLLGSFHCVGMCGPIALALPLGKGTVIQRLLGVFIYNLGRIVTYSMAGLAFGLAGRTFALAGLQQYLSVALGVAVLLFFFVPSLMRRAGAYTNRFIAFTTSVKSALSKLFSIKTRTALFSIGLLNGLLPCGLVYMGVAGAMATGDAMQGAFFMAFFGLGTLPVMMAVALSKDLFSVSLRNHMRKAVPYFVSIMAVLLIVRGLNLGIPYLSPKISKQTSSFASCHDPSKPCFKKK